MLILLVTISLKLALHVLLQLRSFYHELLNLEFLLKTQLSNYESPTFRLLTIAGPEDEEE